MATTAPAKIWIGPHHRTEEVAQIRLESALELEVVKPEQNPRVVKIKLGNGHKRFAIQADAPTA